MINKFMDHAVEELIEDQSIKNGLDEDLVKSICLTESAMNPWAMRFEPAWRYFVNIRDYADKNMISYDTEQALQACSWGLMQIMGSVCRELGYDAELSKLITPELSVQYGCLKLKKLSQKYSQEAEIIASYNAGSVIKTPGNMFVNQKYVDRVYLYLNGFRKLK